MEFEVGPGRKGDEARRVPRPRRELKHPTYARRMDRLRTILILRGLLAVFFVVVGVVVIAGGDVVFGVFAVLVGVVNAVLIAVLVRRARPR